MATISASEANRSFSSLLRQVAQGERFTVLSRGPPVADISPPSASGEEWRKPRRLLLERLSSQPCLAPREAWSRADLYD